MGVYDNFLRQLPQHASSFPFLPIEAFKHERINAAASEEVTFMSSGTTGMQRSQHHVYDAGLYKTLSRIHFESHFGPLESLRILALLPSYQSAGNSSLVYMVNHFIECAAEGSAFMPTPASMAKALKQSETDGVPTLLFGVSYALLDLCEIYQSDSNHIQIIETGGMKGRRKEITRAELHGVLRIAFPNAKISSEYGMCELLSQAYTLDGEVFELPPWARVCVTEVGDPLNVLPHGRRGLLAFSDLANAYSCSFIQTRDIGIVADGRHFTVEGRLDHSDIRGCNLLFS